MPAALHPVRHPTHHPANDASPRTPIGMLLLLLLTFALRVVALDRLGLAYDEAATALMARARPLQIIAFHWNAGFEHPPVWVLLMHGWSQLAGQSAFALRFLPALAGTLLVVMIWRLVRTIVPNEPLLAALSAVLVAFAPILVYYSQEARMYTLVVLLMLLSFQLALQLRMQPNWNRAAWKLVITFWLVSWGMLGLHYYAALGLATQAAVIAIEGVFAGPIRRVSWGKLLIAFAGAILPLLFWMRFSPGFHTTLAVVLTSVETNSISWQFYLSDLWRELMFGNIRWLPPLADWAYVVAPLVVLGAIIVAFQPGRTATARVGAWIVMALALLPILSGVVAFRTLAPRYILWVVPMCYVLIAVVATKLWRRQWLAGLVIMLIVIGVDILALQHYFGPYRKSEYREMTQYLQAHGDPHQEILLLEAPRQHLLTKYYVAPEWSFHPMPTISMPDYWPVTAPHIIPEDEDDSILAWLTELEGLWVSYTSEAEVDAGEFLAKYLTAVAYREHCTQWLDVRLCHYVSPHHLAPVELAPAPLLFGDELALVDAQAAFYKLPPDTRRLLVQLDWHAQEKPTVDYKVALRLVSAGNDIVDSVVNDTVGHVAAQADDYPIGPLLVPTTWNQNDRKPGYITLPLPPNLPPGRYQLQVSLYDANTLTPTSYTALNASPGSSTILESATEPRTIAEVYVNSKMGDDTREGGTMEILPAPIEPFDN